MCLHCVRMMIFTSQVRKMIQFENRNFGPALNFTNFEFVTTTLQFDQYQKSSLSIRNTKQIYAHVSALRSYDDIHVASVQNDSIRK